MTRNHATRILVHLLDGDMETVLAHLDAIEALEPRARLGPPVEGFLVSSAVRASFAVGDLDRGRVWLGFAHTTASSPVFDALIEALQVQADLLAGSLKGLDERIRRVTADFARRGARPHLGHFEALVVQAEVELAGGRLASAARSTREALTHAELLGYDWSRVRAGAVDAQLALLSGHPAAALAGTRATRLGLGRDVSPRLLASLDAVEARALIRLGRLPSAAATISAMADGPHRALAAAAAALAERRGSDDVAALLAGADAWRAPSASPPTALLAAAVCGDEGMRILQRAVDEAASLGVVSPFLGHGPRVDAALARLALGRLHPALAAHVPSSGAAAGLGRSLEPLTPRERDVLQLLPSHLSNAEIAQRLYVSVNTVKSNLKSIYQKLSVSSRSAAVEVALAYGLL